MLKKSKQTIIMAVIEKLLPKLIELVIKYIEELVKYDLDQDGKIGR